MNPLLDFLASLPLFGTLSGLELNAVSAFLERRAVPAGTVVFREGDQGQELYIVRTGSIGSSVVQADGTVRRIYDFGPGRFFGEMAIVEGCPRSATCWAMVDTELLVLEGIDFYRLVFEHPIIGYKVLTEIGKTMVGWLDESSRFLTDLVRWGETARRRVVEDPLTGLFNRRFLEESLATRFSALSGGGRKLGLIMMDLDRFRDINASNGAAGGDRALYAVASALRPLLREGDIPVHLSGDEFAFLLPDTDYEEALIVAERLRSCVDQLVLDLAPAGASRRQIVPVSASLGVSIAPTHAATHQELFASADRALAQAKAEGRNRVVGA